jgi:hypothetical protein
MSWPVSKQTRCGIIYIHLKVPIYMDVRDENSQSLSRKMDFNTFINKRRSLDLFINGLMSVCDLGIDNVGVV